jgi:hypothetical protein
MDSQNCGSAADCIDPDGDTGSAGSCSTCSTGNLQCSGSVLQTCQSGSFMNTTDCAATARQCIDPLPQGGTDAYCGVCVNGAKRCLGTGLQVCTNGAWTGSQTCDATFGGCFDPDGESGAGGYCRVCTDNNTRCANGNLETCVTGQWVAQAPACSSVAGNTCFDPAPAGGTDAYCGNCLKGADRCNGSTIQTCPNGTWTNAGPACGLGCYDPSGDQSATPAAYCGQCTNGNLQCSGTTLQTCGMGQFTNLDFCPNHGASFSCYDPNGAGGTDAYCGVCLAGTTRCNGDDIQKCNDTGQAWDPFGSCPWGCKGNGTCCGAPACGATQECGVSQPNECGAQADCGDCGTQAICCENSFCFGATDPSLCP